MVISNKYDDDAGHLRSTAIAMSMIIKMCHTCEWNSKHHNNVPHIYTRYSVKKISKLVSYWQAESNS